METFEADSLDEDLEAYSDLESVNVPFSPNHSNSYSDPTIEDPVSDNVQSPITEIPISSDLDLIQNNSNVIYSDSDPLPSTHELPSVSASDHSSSNVRVAIYQDVT